MIELYNTLTKKKEEFKPQKAGFVSMYNCGPTVYNYSHIGNLRAYIFADVLRKTLEYNGYKVDQVINITDVGHLTSDQDEGDDKMTKALKREGKPFTLEAMKELAIFYTEKFISDLTALNISLPSYMPKASEHIKEDIDLILSLEKNGFTYTISDGVYFDTSKSKKYGQLAGIIQNKDDTEARIKINPEKKNPKDFALWKFNTDLGWEAPWGMGFPGWHIECSAMSMKYLGETLDIHTGGVDHIPVHHSNEIAQSEAITNKTFVNYWLHSEFVNIGEEKMAKSEENFLRLQSIIDKNISPIAYRYWILTAHYRKTINFNWDILEGAKKTLNKLYNQFNKYEDGGQINQDYKDKFLSYINDDLNTPKAIALIWELIKDGNLSSASKKATLADFDKVLGLDLISNSTKKELPIPEEVEILVKERENARIIKNWSKSDELRAKINALGYDIKDTPSGPKIVKK